MCTALVIASCTKVRTYEKPQVQEYGLTIVSAHIGPIEIEGLGRLNDHAWTETDTLGVYGSDKGINIPYVPCMDGSLDRFCGDIVSGVLNLYYPYKAEGCQAARGGRMPLPAKVAYKADVSDFVFSNMTFVAQGEGDDFSFNFPLGMVEMSLSLDIKDCRSVGITVSNSEEGYSEWICGDLSINGSVHQIVNGSKELVIQEIGGLDSSESAPLKLYFAAPEALYENLIISMQSGEGEPVVQVCKGPLQIVQGCLTRCTVKEFKPEYGLGDYSSESGMFNE